MQEVSAENMIRRQVRTWDVFDHDVLEAMIAVPRDRFVDQAYQGVAFAEAEVPGKNGCLIRPSREIGRLLALLSLRSTDSIALVGPDSGYMVTLLARLGYHVTWFLPNVGSQANSCQKPDVDLFQSLKNVTVLDRSFSEADGPFDAIVVMGAMHTLPQYYLDALREDGRIFVVLGESSLVMTAWLISREGEQDWRKESVFEVRWPWLPGAAPEEHFIF